MAPFISRVLYPLIASSMFSKLDSGIRGNAKVEQEAESRSSLRVKESNTENISIDLPEEGDSAVSIYEVQPTAFALQSTTAATTRPPKLPKRRSKRQVDPVIYCRLTFPIAQRQWPQSKVIWKPTVLIGVLCSTPVWSTMRRLPVWSRKLGTRSSTLT